LLLVWIGFIFGTSCTVIRPQEFFALVQKYANVNEASMLKFEIFWGASWFLIVKGWHFTEFAILFVLCATVLRLWRGNISPLLIMISTALCLLFAMSDEWHQTFVPDRNGTVTDVLIDSLGVCVAAAFLLLRYRSKIRQGETT